MQIRFADKGNKKFVCVKDALNFLGSVKSPGRFIEKVAPENRASFNVQTKGGKQAAMFILADSMLALLQTVPGPAARELEAMVAEQAGVKIGAKLNIAPKSVLHGLLSDALYYEGKEIPCYEKDGKHWFSASVVCGILGIKNVSDACEKIHSNFKGVANTIGFSDRNTTPERGNPNALFLTAEGVTFLVISSNKPKAQDFQLWLLGEILPQLAKGGVAFESKEAQWEYEKQTIDKTLENLKILGQALRLSNVEAAREKAKIEYLSAIGDNYKPFKNPIIKFHVERNSAYGLCPTKELEAAIRLKITETGLKRMPSRKILENAILGNEYLSPYSSVESYVRDTQSYLFQPKSEREKIDERLKSVVYTAEKMGAFACNDGKPKLFLQSTDETMFTAQYNVSSGAEKPKQAKPRMLKTAAKESKTKAPAGQAHLSF